MTKFRQIHYDNEKSDCWRAAIGCLLDIHPYKIPNFCYKYPHDNLWLRKTIDYCLSHFGKILFVLPANKYKGEYIGIKYNSVVAHALIYNNGKLIWNPSGLSARWGKLAYCIKLFSLDDFIDFGKKKFKIDDLIERSSKA